VSGLIVQETTNSHSATLPRIYEKVVRLISGGKDYPSAPILRGDYA
jgi:hypothetical protein